MVCTYEEYKEYFPDSYKFYCLEEKEFTFEDLLSYQLNEYGYAESYTDVDTCCIFICFGLIAMEYQEDICSLETTLEQIFQEDIMELCREELQEEFPLFLEDCEKVKKALAEAKER